MNPLRLRVALAGRRAVRVRAAAVAAAATVRPACASMARRFESTAPPPPPRKQGPRSFDDMSRDFMAVEGAAAAIGTEFSGIVGKLPPSSNDQHHPQHHHGEHHEHDDHHHEHQEHDVKEPLGVGFWTICAIIPSWMLVYNLSQPDADGNLPAITRVWADYQQGLLHHWQAQSDMQFAALEEAGHERHLLYYAPRPAGYDLSYPEVFDHGSKRSVPAGHYINLDQVKEHYRKKYMEDEARKANKLRSRQEANPVPAPKEE